MSTDKCLYKEEVAKLNELLLTDFEMEHLRAVTYVLWAVHMTDSAAQDPHVASGVCYLRTLTNLLYLLSVLSRKQEDWLPTDHEALEKIAEISSSEMELCEEHDDFVRMKVAKLL